MDSLIQIVTTAGVVAVIPLLWCLITRQRREPGNRGLFQRLPALLPAVTFVIAAIIIVQYGLIPMSVYHGGNQAIHYGAHTKDNMIFNVYDTDIAYVDEIEVELQTTVDSEQFLLISVEFVQNDTVVESINLNLTGTSVPPDDDYIYTVNLDSGRYSIQVNGTLYTNGIPEEEINYLNLYLFQAIQPSFQPEIVDWVSYQFFLNIGCFLVFLAGLCIGREDRDRRSKERIDQEPPRGDEYLRPFH